ncbi:platelet-derived growth factor C-like isoform X1 [Centruroides vittatus]|uniref:platelet-derived growth factor C-like isoform X1 n=2 Tax=Centruroides vittatus TaxID=120091 RepID=UPI00350F839F
MYSVLLVLFTMTTFGYSKPTLDPDKYRKIQIPESLLMKLSDVQNVSYFMSHFISSTQVTRKPALGVFLAYLEKDEDKSVHVKTDSVSTNNDSIVPVADQASCIPELKIVELPRPTDPTEIFWPPCTRVRRCGGCCTSRLLKCAPVATSTISVKLIKARYSVPASNRFDHLGYEIVHLEQHDKCRCVCREKAEDCTSLQVYSADKCKCECKNNALISSCTGSDRHWDRRDCSCKCNVYEDCSTGFFFNPQSCKCESLNDPLRGLPSSENSRKSIQILKTTAVNTIPIT